MATLPDAPTSSQAPVVAGAPQPPEELTKLFSSISIDDEDSELIDALKALSKKSPKLVRSSEYKAPAEPSLFIRSWKMNEFKYYDIPSPFPTLARGLFTQEIKVSNKMKHRIVVRGYDKFFNIGEVPWTTWASLESHTAPPYTLTLKSNGCIIFIAALTSEKLLVTSKHSLGPVGDAPESHAQAGERWLRKHLASAGKTEAQLAQTLWDKNWTAVAELCDDSFEEHVLPYGPEKTGLHLHGLNSCTKRFQTQSQDVVDAFAKEWGFIVTVSTVLHTIPEVKSFTEEVGRSGSWNGEALEGFVVRTHVTDPPTKGGKPASASPYPVGSSFFFKVKFDEPYLMYRDWREVTKTLLSKGPNVGNVPKGKLRRPETKLYVQWVCDEIKRDKQQFDGFTKGKGIIAARNRFLRYMESAEGKQASNEARSVPDETGLSKDVDLKGAKTIIVPVAVPGVGKTTIAIALAHLFGFGHVQSDDISGKRPAPIFIKNVVIVRPPAKLLALNWSFDLPMSTIHRICGDRILARGDKHQSLLGDAETKAHEEVVWQFLKNAEELTDAEVDVVGSMDVEEPLEDALTRAVGVVVKYIGLPQPDAEAMGQALSAARSYEPTLKGGAGNKTDREQGKSKGKGKGKNKHQNKRKGKVDQDDHMDLEEEDAEPPSAAPAPPPQPKKAKAPPSPRYFGILAEVDLVSVVSAAFADPAHAPAIPAEGHKLWEKLRTERRVLPRPHVTLVHSKSLVSDGEKALWARCGALHALPHPPFFLFRLGHVVWNERVMAVTVLDVAADTKGGDAADVGEDAVGFVAGMPEEVRGRLHITVGTRHQSIPPVEARDLVVGWKSGALVQGQQVWAVPVGDVWVKGRVKGLY
ncbi:RNA ligase-domain-containing protein [Daedaleopsis nitida]|nr:RNA ligase-domain-containing protein [Daedaleopsis nitida]